MRQCVRLRSCVSGHNGMNDHAAVLQCVLVTTFRPRELVQVMMGFNVVRIQLYSLLIVLTRRLILAATAKQIAESGVQERTVGIFPN